MADVLIVCVREDEPQAKALAEMFEAAGFSVGGAPSSDGALRGSGAGLVVWSQASIRSRPFLDAAQRVINANKAVVASLIEPPPPSSIGDSPAFDLSGWTGDPNDPALDPLFFAVDRMVNSARAEVAAPAQEQRYEPPPRQAPPPPPYARRSAPPASEPPPAPMPQGFNMRNTRGPSGGDALGSEAEHWRAIRNSRNPADFMDYLARYGADGAFADVAELRLKQLTSSSSAPEPRAPVRAPPPPPQVRLDPPPQRRPDPPPQRRADPPPRRTEVQAPRRPTYDRGYNETRDPPKGEGGALRAFVLIAILGGLALAGGLYFGGGLNGGANNAQHQQASTDASSQAPPDASSVEPTDGSSVPLSDAVSPSAPAAAPLTAQQQRQQQQQQQRQQEREQQREQQRTQQRNADNNAATPAPVTSWTDGSNSGPVSLRPGEQASNAQGQVVVPLGPAPAPTQTQVASNTPPATTRPAAVGAVLWTQRPSSRRIAELYPDRALRSGSGGRVELDCTVRANLSAECSVASESPAGMGFGRAALGAVTAYRARDTLSNGQPSSGAHTRIAIQFQPPSE